MCGKRLDDPVEQPTLPGLEPTSFAPTAMPTSAARMPGFEPTRLEDVPEVSAAPLSGFEPTRINAPEVASERMPGLVTNEEVLGDTRIPDEPLPESPRCPRCQVTVAEARFCPRCGYAVAVAHAEDDGDAPLVLCLECGVPNPPERTKCMTCGNRM